MEVRITTTERSVKKGGMLSREMEAQYVLTCSIRLTPDEARLFPISGNNHHQLTDEHFEREGTYQNYIDTKKAIEGEDSCYFLSLGQMRSEEITLKARCRDIYERLKVLSDYEVEKSYTYDPSED